MTMKKKGTEPVEATGPDRTIPKPEGHMTIGDKMMVVLPAEEWERVVDTLMDYFDALDVQEMMDDPAEKSIPWEEARKELFANNIRAVRKRKKVTQAELAARLGVTQAWISELEQPDHRPTPETYKKVARALGCAVEVLMFSDK